jgi:hypothetical protein
MLWLALAFLVWLLAAVALVLRKTRPYAWPLALAMAGTFPGVFLFQIIAAPVVIAVLIVVWLVGQALEPGPIHTTDNPVVIAMGVAAVLTIFAFVLGMSVAGFYEGWRTGWLVAKGENWQDVIRQRWPVRLMRAALKRFANGR